MTELEDEFNRMRKRLYSDDAPKGYGRLSFLLRFNMLARAVDREQAGLKPWPTKWELWLERWCGIR